MIAFPPLSDPTSVSSARIVVDDDVPDVDNDDQPRHEDIDQVSSPL